MKPSFGDNQDRRRCASLNLKPTLCVQPCELHDSLNIPSTSLSPVKPILNCFPELPLLTAVFSCQEVISQHSYQDGNVTAVPRPDYGFLWCSHLDLPREKVNNGIENTIHDGDPWAPREEAQGDSGRIRQLVSACSQGLGHSR